jgi:pimeloyl-ACP methyl ester carboxylesterase
MSASSKINDSPGHFMVLQAIARGVDTVDKIATATRKSRDEVTAIINDLVNQRLANMSGACAELAKTARPTLAITGTEDNNYQPHVNSLKIVEKIPGAWLVQIKDAGHAVMDQYPEEIGKIVNTFLSTISN